MTMHSIDKESTNSGVAILIHIVGVYEYKNDENNDEHYEII